MNSQDRVIEEFLNNNAKHRQQCRRIIQNVKETEPEFFRLSSGEMSVLLVDKLKLDKFNTLNIYLAVLSSLFEFAVGQNQLERNIFEEADLSRTILCREISRNILLIREDMIMEALKGRQNRTYIEAANRLLYDGAGANWSDLGVLRWSEISTFFWTVDSVRVSKKTIEVLEELRSISQWQYSGRAADLTRPTDNHVFGFVNKVVYDNSEEVIMKKLNRFMKDNCILYYGKYKLDPQKLYCSGIACRIIQKYGEDFFTLHFTETIRDLHYVNEVIKEFGLKITPGNLRKMLLPYGMKVKYGT